MSIPNSTYLNRTKARAVLKKLKKLELTPAQIDDLKRMSHPLHQLIISNITEALSRVPHESFDQVTAVSVTVTKHDPSQALNTGTDYSVGVKVHYHGVIEVVQSK